MTESTKRCPKCGETKPLSAFSRMSRSKDGRQCYCKACAAAGNSAYHTANRDQIGKRHRQRYTRRQAASKGWRHGLTADDLNNILDAQGWVCPGCGHDLSDGDYVVEHDHSHCSGVTGCPVCVRGLTCRKCNGALGMANDDPAVLRRLLAYLERTNAEVAERAASAKPEAA